MRVRSLIGEDPLEKEMASHFGILGWEIPWTEEPGWSQSTGLQRVGHDWERDAWEFFIHVKKKFSKTLNVLLTSRNLKFFVSYLGHLLFGAFWNMQTYLEKYRRHSLFNPALTQIWSLWYCHFSILARLAPGGLQLTDCGITHSQLSFLSLTLQWCRFGQITTPRPQVSAQCGAKSIWPHLLAGERCLTECLKKCSVSISD